MCNERRAPRIFAGILLAGLALLAGCEKTPPPPQSAPVFYMEATPESYTLYTELSGRTSPYAVSEVRPQVSGIIQRRVFTEGADVAEGELLYQIDPSLYQAAYDNAKANLMKAEATVVSARLLAERYRQVVKANAVSKQEYDDAVARFGQAKADVAAAKAALDSARINLEYTKVISPIAGRIGRSSVTAGALVTQNQQSALATVQQLDPIYVDVTQSSTDLLRLRRAFEDRLLRSSGEGAVQATLKLEDGTLYTRRIPKKDAAGQPALDASGHPVMVDEPVVGTLEFREVSVDASTGTITIRARFPNPNGILLPNMYVRAVVQEGVTDNAFFIPQKAIVRDNRGRAVAQVLTREANSTEPADVFDPQPRVLTLDRARDQDWLVTKGLKAGDKVLVEGLQQVQAGKPVRGIPVGRNGTVSGAAGAAQSAQPGKK